MRDIKWERPYLQSIPTQHRDEWAVELARSSEYITPIRSGDRIVIKWGTQVFDCLITGYVTVEEVRKTEQEV